MNNGCVAAARNLIRKFLPPKMWRWSQKFNSHSLSLIAQFTQKHNSALDFLLRFRIRDHQQFAVVHFVFQHQQAAVFAHHQRFADFPELFAIVCASLRLHLQLAKDSRAAPRSRKFGCSTHVLIFCATTASVNSPVRSVFRMSNEHPPSLVLCIGTVLQ